MNAVCKGALNKREVDMDIKELNEKAAHYKEHMASKKKEGYHYARSRGFNSYQATLLASKSKEEIDRLSKELLLV